MAKAKKQKSETPNLDKLTVFETALQIQGLLCTTLGLSDDVVPGCVYVDARPGHHQVQINPEDDPNYA